MNFRVFRKKDVEFKKQFCGKYVRKAQSHIQLAFIFCRLTISNIACFR
jgi:hypothetical protein